MVVRGFAILLLASSLLTCSKVPLDDVGAGFSFAKSAWFEAEETLFLFYDVGAVQGISHESVVEVSWESDDGVQPFVPVSTLTNVHEHVAVDCGVKRLCGSASPRVAKPPRNVRFRLRYHKEGELGLDVWPAPIKVVSGPAYSNRSAIAYGVFDGQNKRMQWRLRHSIPDVKNSEATHYGLRRYFRVNDEKIGEVAADLLPSAQSNNHYLYGASAECPSSFGTSLSTPAEGFSTSTRSVWSTETLSDALSSSPAGCAKVTVRDGKGEFSTSAFARKNPEVRPAYDSIRTSVAESHIIRVVLKPCKREVALAHFLMQKQRLGISNEVSLCIDEDDGLVTFTEKAAAFFANLTNEQRTQGKDMIFAIAFHHFEDEVPPRPLQYAVENALVAVLTPEAAKTTPRLAGAFIFDSVATLLSSDDLKKYALWCPQLVIPQQGKNLPPVNPGTCAVLPDVELKLGPFAFGVIDILPTRARYLNFIKNNPPENAGKMKRLRFLVPGRSPLSEDVAVGNYGKATFFNNDQVTVNPGEALSYCFDSSVSNVYFRTKLAPTVALPLSGIGLAHRQAPQTSYDLGLFWEFPFLLRLEYEAMLAGRVNVIAASVPFAISNTSAMAYGPAVWEQPEFNLKKALTLCTRFCSHPTFDSAGVYNVQTKFNHDFAAQCYAPALPSGEALAGGFPNDPP